MKNIAENIRVINRIIIAIGIFVFVFSVSCKSGNDEKPVKIDKEKVKKIIEETNKKNVAIEDRQIDDYLGRRHWNFERTGSGLRYKIYSKGSGLRPEPEDVVYLEYTLSLIRGDLVYDSKKDGQLVFRVDHDDVPAGLHEVVKLMRVGDKAKAVIPSYLGYGVTGDQKEVPARATLIYDLQLVRVKR